MTVPAGPPPIKSPSFLPGEVARSTRRWPPLRGTRASRMARIPSASRSTPMTESRGVSGDLPRPVSGTDDRVPADVGRFVQLGEHEFGDVRAADSWQALDVDRLARSVAARPRPVGKSGRVHERPVEVGRAQILLASGLVSSDPPKDCAESDP